jgi:hypothetical protein
MNIVWISTDLFSQHPHVLGNSRPVMPMAPDAFGDFSFLRIWHVDHVCLGVWFRSFVQFEDSCLGDIFISSVIIYVFSVVNVI